MYDFLEPGDSVIFEENGYILVYNAVNYSYYIYYKFFTVFKFIGALYPQRPNNHKVMYEDIKFSNKFQFILDCINSKL